MGWDLKQMHHFLQLQRFLTFEAVLKGVLARFLVQNVSLPRVAYNKTEISG